MKKLFLALSLLAFSCSNSELETLKRANEELATENVKLKAENKAMEAQLALAKMFTKKQADQSNPDEQPIQTVSSNMFVVQEMVKLYESKNKSYPSDLDELNNFLKTVENPPGSEAFGPGDINNPVQGGSWQTDDNGLKLGVASKGCSPGETYYQPMSKKGEKYTNYSITGCDESGKPLSEPGTESSVMILTAS